MFMFNLNIIILLSLTITMILFTISMMISKKNKFNREKMSPFECGFDPMSTYNIPFSVHFFLISLLFLIFDIEITLLIPSVLMMSTFSKSMMYTILIFILTLIIGLYIEYLEKSIDWKI